MKGKSDFLKEEMCRFFLSEIKKKAIDLIDLDQAIDQSVQVVECQDQKYLHRCHGSFYFYHLAVNEIKSSVVLVIQLTIYVFSTCPIIFQSLVLLFCFTLRTVTVNYKMF